MRPKRLPLQYVTSRLVQQPGRQGGRARTSQHPALPSPPLQPLPSPFFSGERGQDSWGRHDGPRTSEDGERGLQQVDYATVGVRSGSVKSHTAANNQCSLPL